ncbi:MAG: TlpA disulfide reductase family protein [Alphaproteobacteria bacterium]|nr:TlpA disulfide reductase family protein [Alphaproteobacteria bacterium]
MPRIHSFLAAACLVFFVASAAHASEQDTVALQTGDFGRAPAFSYADAAGKMHTLDTAKHKLTALHFWATWCVPCVDELPQLDDAQDIFGKELHIAAIALDGKNAAKVQKFYSNHKILHLPVLLDPTAKLPKIAGLRGLPGTLFIDARGNIVGRAEGPLDWQQEDVQAFLKAHLR